MKKLALLLCSFAIGFSVMAQTDTCCQKQKHHSSITSGRTPYIYIGPETSFPIFNKATMQSGWYGYSAEAGLWGTEKSTTFGLVADFLKQNNQDTTVTKSAWLGVKGYLTVWQNSNSVYMLYASPKTLIQHGVKAFNSNLLELGINPCYTINKHILLSVTFCDQITGSVERNNKATLNLWKPGGSIGLVIFK